MLNMAAIDPEAIPNIMKVLQRNGSPEAAAAERIAKLQQFHALTDTPLERYTVAQTYRRGNVGIIQVLGPISRYASMFEDLCAVTSVQTMNKSLQTMLDDEDITEIVMLIDSPGGGVDGLHDFVQRMTKATKRLTAYVDGNGCSAAYWIASACDEIYTSATSRLGSIGVIITTQSPSFLATDEGYYFITNTEAVDKYPDAATDEGKRTIQNDANAVYRIFRNDVIANRPQLTESMINDLKGGVRVGQEAVAAGLADAVDDFEAVLTRLVTTDQTEDTMSVAISPSALQSALVGGTPEASTALLDELKQANSLDALRAELEADYNAKVSDLSGKLDALIVTNEALAARVATLEGEAPQGNHWAGGYIASQSNAAPAQPVAQAQVGGVAPEFTGWLTNGAAQ